MKKLGFIIAALGTIAIAAPSIASAEEMMIRHDHDRMNARADMHRDHGWQRHHHHDRMMMRHRRHDH
jgi:Ni/Co efflux regulator RcnB